MPVQPAVHLGGKFDLGADSLLKEMYVCMKCGKGKCRFCLDEKVEYFYCRLCNDVSAVTEAQSQKYKCQRLL